MSLMTLQKFLPGSVALLGLLGQPQKDWLLANADNLAPFLHSQEGRDALLAFLSQFHKFTVNIAVLSKP